MICGTRTLEILETHVLSSRGMPVPMYYMIVLYGSGRNSYQTKLTLGGSKSYKNIQNKKRPLAAWRWKTRPPQQKRSAGPEMVCEIFGQKVGPCYSWSSPDFLVFLADKNLWTMWDLVLDCGLPLAVPQGSLLSLNILAMDHMQPFTPCISFAPL